jgi:hypothetical protein
MTDTARPYPSASSHLEGTAFALDPTGSSTLAVLPGTGIMTLLKDLVTSNPTASCSFYLLRAADTWRALRTAQIKALRGKYRHVLTPSDKFARHKQEEIARESDVS